MSRTSVLLLLVISAAASITQAADPREILGAPGGHALLTGDMPAGVVAATRQSMGYQQPPPTYYQPVEFHGPEGVRFSLAQYGSFEEGESNLMAGLMIGQVYRFRVTGIPQQAGAELYPTIEMVDRTYPPPGLATSYPIPINLDQNDLIAALEGRLVTRVIYLEDPQTATPLPEGPNGPAAIDVPEYQDPLEIADLRGRTVAILRIGSLAPPRAEVLQSQFFFGHPSWAPIFKPQP
ncbi:hypothetical protein [Allorhodopirellula solitaria]|uniref:Uncharacterized protein n=1 Tax=Allorhodopirellula solitaria TaxID=2527987 RepID=A0A5C5XAE7_9BACT|nr:hypothetical protein [Allorhodopirellula solitaria]TWT59273.1 hypothetical protein CA85_39690 [Allorhodopirellula solitaria]